MPYDIITLGETMLRLTPPDLQRFEQASSFAVHIGGSESNVAVGLARLGLSVAWLSRLTDNPLGHLIAASLRAQNVDVSHVVWTPEDRIGVYFLEEGKAPRGSQIIYDRSGSAISRMQPHELPEALFQPEQARALHLSGITLGIGEAAARTTLEAGRRAKAAGWLLSFDVNYRGRLWSAADAAAGCAPLMEMADLIFLPLRDAAALYHTSEDPQQAAEELRRRFPQAAIVLTLGAAGALYTAGDVLLRQSSFHAEAVGRVGGGDAFVAGFLYGWLQYRHYEEALLWGTAAAAYKYSIPGDMPLFSRSELHSLIQGSGQSSLQR